MMKAVAYLRVSGIKQIGGSGFERQAESIKRYCTTANMNIEKIYREQVSGVKAEDERPIFKQMIVDLLANGTRTIVVEGLDRLARELRIQDQLVIYLASKNIDLIAANTGEVITRAFMEDPMRKALIHMQAVFSELERDTIILRLRKGQEKKRKETGRCGGPLRYGSAKEERDILHRISYMRRLNRGQVRRMTYGEIADRLNAENVPPKAAKQWTGALVYHVHNTKEGNRSMHA